MPVIELEEQSVDKAQKLESFSAVIESKEEEPSIEDKYKFFVEGLKKYEKFLRKGYFDIYYKEAEYQLQRNGLVRDVELGVNSKGLKIFEYYRKFLIRELVKMIEIEVGEERCTRKKMLSFCIDMKWSRVEKILDFRQKIVMQRKKALFDNNLSYIAERSKIFLCYQYYKENDGFDLFMKKNELADYLTAQKKVSEYK